jgi:hypothetical protein
MNHEVVRLEKCLRTLRDRIWQELGSERHNECPAIYIIEAALDTVESSTIVEISSDLGLPPGLLLKELCQECKRCEK